MREDEIGYWVSVVNILQAGLPLQFILMEPCQALQLWEFYFIIFLFQGFLLSILFSLVVAS